MGLTAALGVPGFRRLFGAYAVSRVGDFLFNTALVVVVLDRTGSPLWVSATLLARLIPLAVLTPFTGVLADRVDRKRLMVGTDLTRAAIMIASAVVVATEAPVGALVVLAGLSTAVGAPFLSAFMATMPEVVDERRLGPANAIVSSSEYAAIVIGPLLAAGVLLADLDALPFAINAMTFVGSAAFLAGLRVTRTSGNPVDGDGEGGYWAAAGAGFRLMRTNRLVLLATVLMGVSTLGLGAETVLLPLVSRDLLDTGTEGLGFLEAAVGAGGVLGVALAARAASGNRLVLAMCWATAMAAVPLALLTVVREPWVAYSLLAFEGIGSVALDTTSVTAIQRSVPISHLARVDGLMSSVSVGTMALGNAAGGLLASSVPLTTAMLIVAGGPTVVAGTLAVVFGRYRVQSRAAPGVQEQLSQVPAFAALPPAMLELLADSAEPVRFDPGETLLRQGSRSNDAMVLTSGACDVLAEPSPGATRLVNQVTAPDVVGEIGVLHARPRSATVVATSSVDALRIPGSSVIEALAHPQHSLPVRRVIEARLARWPGQTQRD